jgi:hypothetical protein
MGHSSSSLEFDVGKKGGIELQAKVIKYFMNPCPSYL